MAVQNKLTLKFNTSAGDTFSLPIQNADPNVTQQDVSQAMQDIISYNIFTATAGNLSSIDSAELTRTETTDISINI